LPAPLQDAREQPRSAVNRGEDAMAVARNNQRLIFFIDAILTANAAP
jgi:hypothetical protein